MREFFSSFKFKVLACIFALIFGFMIYVAVTSGASSFPQTVLETVSSPFVSGATSISSWVQDTIDKFANADKYKQENELLRKQLSEMYSDIIEKQKLENENQQLREMLKLAEDNTDFVWSAPCSVTAKNAGDISGGFTINRGTNDGLELYDPIFTSVGLVGIITEIAPTYSKVTTVLSTELNIGVETVNSNVIGVIENDIKYSSDGKCLVSYIPKDSGIEVGELVVTSGGEIFPDKIPVGTVKEIIDDENGLSLNAVIEPLENIFNVSDVYAITSFYGQGDSLEQN